MPHQIGDLISRTAGIGDIAPERMPQLVRGNCPGQSRPVRGGGDQHVDHGRSHRRPDRLAEQVDQHEIRRGRPRHREPLKLVRVERLHRDEIQRHRPLPPNPGSASTTAADCTTGPAPATATVGNVTRK